MSDERLRQMAEDLAAVSDSTVDEAVAALLQSLRGELPPLSRIRKLPWYLRFRWVPTLWKQRWILKTVGLESSSEQGDT